MVAKLFLKLPDSLPVFTLPSKIHIFPTIPSLPERFLILSLFSATAAAQTHPQISDPNNSSYFYGPSLRKGTYPLILRSHPPFTKTEDEDDDDLFNEEDDDDDDLFNEESFSRVFDIAALRIPEKDCSALEGRLRGHLLNWPSIRNIGRVPGDEVEAQLAELLANQGRDLEDENALASLNRRMYRKFEGDGEPLSAVLYREKLAKTFDSRGK